jgi:hypothetical protein
VYTSHLLRRSYRQGGKVRHENLGNLSHLPVEIIEVIRAMLAGRRLVDLDEDFELTRSLRCAPFLRASRGGGRVAGASRWHRVVGQDRQRGTDADSWQARASRHRRLRASASRNRARNDLPGLALMSPRHLRCKSRKMRATRSSPRLRIDLGTGSSGSSRLSHARKLRHNVGTGSGSAGLHVEKKTGAIGRLWAARPEPPWSA